jgi:TPR repeat protein
MSIKPIETEQLTDILFEFLQDQDPYFRWYSLMSLDKFTKFPENRQADLGEKLLEIVKTRTDNKFDPLEFTLLANFPSEEAADFLTEQMMKEGKEGSGRTFRFIAFRALREMGDSYYDGAVEYVNEHGSDEIMEEIMGLERAAERLKRQELKKTVRSENDIRKEKEMMEAMRIDLILEELGAILEKAESGDACAQYDLALKYCRGEGVEQDDKMAVKWFTKSAEQGLAEAQYLLGEMLYVGRGVEQNRTEALEWFVKSAEQGYANAQCDLGRLYYTGRDVEQDYTKALGWVTKAAEQGYPRAQCWLGSVYESGQGVEQDYQEAVKWYTEAAELQDAGGQYKLGFCYYQGHGVSKDYIEGYKWVLLAEMNGYDVERGKQFFESEMTSVEIAKARRRAKRIVQGESVIEGGDEYEKSMWD